MVLVDNAQLSLDQFIMDSTAELTIALFMRNFKRMVLASQRDVLQTMSNGTLLMFNAICAMSTPDQMQLRPNVSRMSVPSTKLKREREDAQAASHISKHPLTKWNVPGPNAQAIQLLLSTAAVWNAQLAWNLFMIENIADLLEDRAQVALFQRPLS